MIQSRHVVVFFCFVTDEYQVLCHHVPIIYNIQRILQQSRHRSITRQTEGYLYQCEYLGDVGEGADLQQGQRLEEAAGADNHEQLGEEVEVGLEVLHAPVVHQLLADLPGGGPPEEHVDQQQEEDRGVEYRQRGGAHLVRGILLNCASVTVA